MGRGGGITPTALEHRQSSEPVLPRKKKKRRWNEKRPKQGGLKKSKKYERPRKEGEIAKKRGPRKYDFCGRTENKDSQKKQNEGGPSTSPNAPNQTQPEEPIRRRLKKFSKKNQK